MLTTESKVFMNGNSQAVRIPKALRLPTSRVRITRGEQGTLVIHPLSEDRGTALLNALADFDNNFIAALEENRREQAVLQDREVL